jgi:GxxExxY protein
MNENELAAIVVDCCFHIHRELGPGLFESVYEEVLAYELSLRGLVLSRQVDVPVQWDGKLLGTGFRADIIVESKIIVELKSIERVLPVHQKQLLTYLRLTNMKLGLLINFNKPLIKTGIQRIVNGL